MRHGPRDRPCTAITPWSVSPGKFSSAGAWVLAGAVFGSEGSVFAHGRVPPMRTREGIYLRPLREGKCSAGESGGACPKKIRRLNSGGFQAFKRSMQRFAARNHGPRSARCSTSSGVSFRTSSLWLEEHQCRTAASPGISLWGPLK